MMFIIGRIPLVHRCPRAGGMVCAPERRECRSTRPGSLSQGGQPADRSANKICSWLSTKSQFWHRACQCFAIRWDARYSIRRSESSLVKLRSEEHTSELQSRFELVCRLLLEKKKHNSQMK